MKKLVLLSIVVLLSFCDTGIYAAMSIPPDVKKTVCFVYIEKDGKEIPNGTGFFVLTRNTSKTLGHVYLVTAKHVLQSDPQKGTFFSHCIIRLTKKKGGVQKLRLPLNTKGKNKNVFCHDDPTVDIAIISALPNQDMFDFKPLPFDYLTGKDDFKKLNVSEGSDVFFVGMFTPHLGAQQNYPIVRFGRVALLSDEKVKFMDQMRDLYLLETFSFGGNSGSPVFIYLGSDRQPGSLIVGVPVLKLAGVMSGTFRKASKVLEIQTATTDVSFDNMGIAAVVPCYHLQEIILSDELQKARGY